MSRTDHLDNADLQPNSLVGSYFHTFESDDDDGPRRVESQGVVVAEPSSGIYLVEFFSWLHGGSSSQRLATLNEMFAWEFYDTADWMNHAYETRWSNASRTT